MLVYILISIVIALLLAYFFLKPSPKRDLILKRNYKLVIIVNNELKMTKGKIISQACHAVSETVLNTPTEILKIWRKKGQPKIVLKGIQEDIHSLIKQCKKENILYNNIYDAGKTQVMPGSNTVLAIGPESEEILSNITGHLKLL